MCLLRCKLGFPSEPPQRSAMTRPWSHLCGSPPTPPAPRAEGLPHLLQGQKVRLQEGAGTGSPSGNISGPRSDFMFSPSRAMLYASRAFKAGMDVVKSERLDAPDGAKPVLTLRKTGQLPDRSLVLRKQNPGAFQQIFPVKHGLKRR